MSKKILIDSSNTEEIRVAVTVNGRLDDFEIESGKKNAVKVMANKKNKLFSFVLFFL